MARTRITEGSTTKELTLPDLQETIRAITPGMTYGQLLEVARAAGNRDAPGILQVRFLFIDENNIIRRDYFLSLVASEGFSDRVLKVMFFLWVFDDIRLRRFICERVADGDGLWRENALNDNANEDILQPYFTAGTDTAHKSRTNLVQMLRTLNIYRGGQTPVFRLDLDDGWLDEAMRTLAQYEDDPAVRGVMLSTPGQYLVSRGLNGLANATTEQLLGLNPVIQDDPIADEELPVTNPGQEWNQPAPTPGEFVNVARLNPVARERARNSHYRLEQTMASAVRAVGRTPLRNDQIDLYFRAETIWFVTEMKSCTDENYQSQVRKGVSQLLEYRYSHRTIVGLTAQLVLVVEISPPARLGWIVDWLDSLGILLVWPVTVGTGFQTRQTPHDELAGIASRI